jgi:hypothetical protein
MATEKELAEIDRLAREHVDAGLADGSIPPLPQEAVDLATRLGCPWPRKRQEVAS